MIVAVVPLAFTKLVVEALVVEALNVWKFPVVPKRVAMVALVKLAIEATRLVIKLLVEVEL